MRPTDSLLDDNSRSYFLSRRRFLCGVILAGLTARLSAQDKPKRIISTAPGFTEALFALGLGPQVVGVSRLCKFPAVVQTLPKVGTPLEPDAEAIARLTPDLVVLERASAAMSDRLNALHIPFIEVPFGTLNDVYVGIGAIARSARVPVRAIALNDRMQHQLAAIQAAAKPLPPTRVLIVAERRAGMLADLTMVGPDNYLQQLLEIAGGTNALVKPGLTFNPHISLEALLHEDPDVIIDLSVHADSEADRQLTSADVVALWASHPKLTAVRKGRVFAGVSDALLIPGPRAPEAAQILFDYLHPNSGQKPNG